MASNPAHCSNCGRACGSPRAARCRKCYAAAEGRTARTRALIAEYAERDLQTREELAQKFGLALNTVKNLLALSYDGLPPEEIVARRRAIASRNGSLGGRPPIWPDCPPELRADYNLLRRKGIPSLEARRMLENDGRRA